MKRVFLCLVLLLALTACGTAPAEKPEPETPASPPAEEPVLPAEPVEERICYQVETVRFQDVKQAEDGTPLLHYEIHIPELTALREDGTVIVSDETGGQALTDTEQRALEITAAFNETFAEWADGKNLLDLENMAKEELDWYSTEGFDWHGGYTWELTTGTYQTERMISVSGLCYTYTGGAHPNSLMLSWNFDLEEGVFFGPELLADEAELRSAAAEEILRQVRTPLEDGTIPADGYWEDYETLIQDWSSYAVSFDEAGMTVVFSPYELAPYAAGPQEFRFSYDWLQPYLGPHGQALLGLGVKE